MTTQTPTLFDPFRVTPDDALRPDSRAALNEVLAQGASDSTITMTSRQIASTTGKGHFHVVRDIQAMLSKLLRGASKADKDIPDFAGTPLTPHGVAYRVTTYVDPQNEKEFEEYTLNRELLFTLMTGYSVKLRQALVNRWFKLEDEFQNRPRPLYTKRLEALMTRSEYDDLMRTVEKQLQKRLIGVTNKRFKQKVEAEFESKTLNAVQREDCLQLLEFYTLNAAKLFEVDQDKRVMDLNGEFQGFYNPLAIDPAATHIRRKY